jgi:hypothetical protein
MASPSILGHHMADRISPKSTGMIIRFVFRKISISSLMGPDFAAAEEPTMIRMLAFLMIAFRFGGNDFPGSVPHLSI